MKLNKEPYSDRKWHDADVELVKSLKPLKHSEEYKRMMKKFLSELYGKELKDEDLPEELRPAKTNDKDNEDDK